MKEAGAVPVAWRFFCPFCPINVQEQKSQQATAFKGQRAFRPFVRFVPDFLGLHDSFLWGKQSRKMLVATVVATVAPKQGFPAETQKKLEALIFLASSFRGA